MVVVISYRSKNWWARTSAEGEGKWWRMASNFHKSNDWRKEITRN
jgi:hypothetical protein